ncbi:MAG: hypothetical protein BWX79_02022 [Alphaproteobacteria bacterium ADurb.Bin100]|nr:MAG: hypothetical protein BWX79_02022 [Alphaproteobacteria bacterium ADurb.Bin100]
MRPLDRIKGEELHPAFLARDVGILVDRRLGQRGQRENVAGAHGRIVVGLGFAGFAVAGALHAKAEVMAHRSRVDVADDFQQRRLRLAPFVVAAVVVQVEVAVGAEAVGVIDARVVVVAAEGVGQAVVARQALGAELPLPAPLAVDGLLDADAAGEVVQLVGLRPGLAVDVDKGVGGRQGVAEQAEARHAGLAQPGVLELALDQGVAGGAPVHRQRKQPAFAIGVGHIALQVGRHGVQAVAETAVFPESPAHVQMTQQTAIAGRFQPQAAQGGFRRTLHHVVHQAPRRAGAGQDAAGALEEFHALLVFQGHRGFAADGQSVAPIVVGLVDDEAADGHEIPVADGVVGVGQ